MDSTPLHPDVQSLDAQALRHGSYHTAYPYHRRMLRTKFACRIASVTFSVIIVVLTAAQDYDFNGLGGWLLGGIVAGVSMSWTLCDLVYVTVQWARWKRRGVPVAKDSWGPPGVHVACQLLIWMLALGVAATEFAGYELAIYPGWGSYWGYYVPSSTTVIPLQGAIVCFIFLLSYVYPTPRRCRVAAVIVPVTTCG